MRICHQLIVFDPVTERVAWQKDLTAEDVAALMPVIGVAGSPDELVGGCWSFKAYLEDYDGDLC